MKQPPNRPARAGKKKVMPVKAWAALSPHGGNIMPAYIGLTEAKVRSDLSTFWPGLARDTRVIPVRILPLRP